LPDYSWYVVQTKPGQTQRAAQELENQGYEIFLPRIEVEKQQRGKRVRIIEPLFPGYVFIELSKLSSNWRPIRSTRGVSRLISFGDNPAIVPDDAIELLRANSHRKTEQTLTPNQAVHINEGPFRHLCAVFVEYDGEQRAFLLLKLLGQWQKLSLPLEAIHPLTDKD